MTKEETQVENAWTNNTKEIAQCLEKGLTVVFLTLGDPITYSTFGYILKKMKQVMPKAANRNHPRHYLFSCSIVQRVSNRILVEGEESLLVTAGAFGGSQIRNIHQVENIAIVKAYKNIKDINSALKEAGMREKGSRCFPLRP
ncbi:MAG: SAM-dependent methyltransferase [Desulfotignum sp.]|nr:SAM-dependent methyltransferase [Desulfotignum sp.]